MVQPESGVRREWPAWWWRALLFAGLSSVANQGNFRDLIAGIGCISMLGACLHLGCLHGGGNVLSKRGQEGTKPP